MIIPSMLPGPSLARGELTAAVDIGSNTVRLLVASVNQGILNPVYCFRKITRLAGGLTEDTGLAPAAMQRTLSALLEVKEILLQYGVERLRAVGTEALRKAANGKDFVQEAQRLTGLDIHIIDGVEEARLSCLGVLSALATIPHKCLIFDIGGGSTEFILWENHQISFQASYPLGVVRLSEKGHTEENKGDTIKSVLAHLELDLRKAGLFAEILRSEVPLIGTAGTVTTLAAIDLKMSQYDRDKINNHTLSTKNLGQMLEPLEMLCPVEREDIPGMEKGRGDLILPGLRTVLALMALFQKDSLVVSDAGLLEGVILDLDDRRVS